MKLLVFVVVFAAQTLWSCNSSMIICVSGFIKTGEECAEFINRLRPGLEARLDISDIAYALKNQKEWEEFLKFADIAKLEGMGLRKDSAFPVG